MLPANSPLDLLAEEFGAVAGRIEREIRQGFEVATAKLDARIAALELHVHKAETTRDALILERLASLRDGEPGPPGESVKGEKGDRGEPGESIGGEKGERGSLILTGIGPPSEKVGRPDDVYIDTATGDLYEFKS